MRLRAPVPKPGKIVAIGLNYRDHAAESGQPIPEEPILFAKFANSVIGPGEAIQIPRATDRADYEAELGVVIGRTAREVARDDALSVVAGYTCVNDVSARDLQLRVSQWTRGKAIDTFLPMGPWLVTPDEIPDPGHLAIRCVLNGDVMQDSNTDQMIFGVAELVSFISQTITLEPGDVIATGTPPGVGFLATLLGCSGRATRSPSRSRASARSTNPVRYCGRDGRERCDAGEPVAADRVVSDHRRGVGHRRRGGEMRSPRRAGRSSSATSQRRAAARRRAVDPRRRGQARSAIVVDVCDRAVGRRAGVDRGHARFGGFDAVCPNAGIGFAERPSSRPVTTSTRLIDVNLNAARSTCCSPACPHVRDGGASSSRRPRRGSSRTRAAAVYAATKIALIGLGRSLALELAGRSIRVNMVCPGAVDTPMIRGVWGSEAEAQRALAEYAETNPLRRVRRTRGRRPAIAVPRRSPDARHITGVSLRVDGGDGLMGAV